MNLRLTIKYWALGAVALCIATGTDAFTLGRARGSALLGQPLELSIVVQTAPDELVAIECFDADVFYGDNRQDPVRVRVNVTETLPGQALSVKVVSLSAVDEPVVTVYLRGGCGQKSTRKYVLLADMASEPANGSISASSSSVKPATAVVDRNPPVVAAVVLPPDAAQNAENLAAPKKTKPAIKAKSEAVRSTDRPATFAPQSQSAVKKSRLKLAAIDLPERDPILRLTNELLSSPAEDLQKRAEALATWRSLTQTAQEVLSEQAHMRAVDEDLKVLREQTAKNHKELLELGGRLEKAEAQRYANPLVYGLLLLVAVLFVGLAWAWKQLRNAHLEPYPWWSGSGQDVNHAHVDLPIDTPVRDSITNPISKGEDTQVLLQNARPDVTHTPASQSAVNSVDIDIDLQMDIGPSAFSPMTPSEKTTSLEKLDIARKYRNGPNAGTRDFAHSVAGTLRAINSQELLDVRQQADFFMTLGQYEDAIHLLETDIRDKGESNPLIYLDLLKILHTLSRKDEFERYRKEFNLLFTGEVPEYVHFNQSGNRLDQYPEVCREIVGAWNTESALEVIEQFLVKTNRESLNLHFDLDAYQDLLMLHAVAGRLDGLSESRLAPFSASRTVATVESAQADGVVLESSSTGSGSPDTAPLPSIGDAMSDDLDLNLDSGKKNLIDFEISGFSNSGGPNTTQK